MVRTRNEVEDFIDQLTPRPNLRNFGFLDEDVLHLIKKYLSSHEELKS